MNLQSPEFDNVDSETELLLSEKAYADLFFEKAEVHYENGNLEAAINDLQIAHCCAPANPYILLFQARIFEETHQYGAVLEVFEKIFIIDRTFLETHEEYLAFFERMKEIQSTRASYEQEDLFKTSRFDEDTKLRDDILRFSLMSDNPGESKQILPMYDLHLRVKEIRRELSQTLEEQKGEKRRLN